MFEHSLSRAFHSLSRPIIHLSPFPEPVHHFLTVVLPQLLIGAHSPPPNHDQPWAHLFYLFIRFLCLTPEQFHFLVKGGNTTSSLEREQDRWAQEQVLNPELPQNWFAARPTVLLRVLIPRTGFSVVVRALLDTGYTTTTVNSELANLLTDNGAQVRYVWPINIQYFKSYGMISQTLDGSGLLLKSVEKDVTGWFTVQPYSMNINDSKGFSIELTHLPTLCKVLRASRVVPEVFEPWEWLMEGIENAEVRALWKPEASLGTYKRVDMIIGRDLQDRFVFFRPRQPTYLIHSSLAMIRTKLGMVFSGWFHYQKHTKWEMNPEDALYKLFLEHGLPQQIHSKVEPSLSLASQIQLNKSLTLKFSNYRPLTFQDFYHSFLFLLLLLHLAIFLPFAILFALLFQVIITITFNHHHFPSLRKRIIKFTRSYHTSYLLHLIRIAVKMRELYFRLLNFALHLFGCSISPQLMNFDVDACLPLTISSGNGNSRTVNAFIDSGSSRSYISSQLVGELGAETVQMDDWKMARVTVSEPTNNSNISSSITEVVELIEDSTLTHFQYGSSTYLHPYFVNIIARFLDGIPLHPPSSYSSTGTGYDLVLGADLLTYLLTPRTTYYESPRVISLLPNLSAFETRFGYYLQGTQNNMALDYVVFNWIPFKLFPFTDWSFLGACLLVDVLLFSLLLVTSTSCQLDYQLGALV